MAAMRHRWELVSYASALVLAVLCLCPSTGSGQGRPPIACKPSSEQIVCAVDIGRAFDADLKKRLVSGFTNTLVYRLYIRRVSDDKPIALTAWRKLQVFELWDEHHLLYEGDQTQHRSVLDNKAVVDRLSVYTEIVAAGVLPAGEYYADIIVEVNPLGETEEAEIRSWIARSRGGHKTFAAGDRSYLGTFVSLFVNIRPGSAQRSFRYQTRAFRIGPEP
jgi:hypothetical protein